MTSKLFFTLFFCVTALLSSLENSIVPQIETLEDGKHLDAKKYAARQYEQILSAIAHKKERIRVVSYNVLFPLYDHNLDDTNKWPQRLPRVTQAIKEMQPDILGLQEVYPNQRDDLQKALPDKYASFFPNHPEGEINGIFYNKHRFNIIDTHVYYLSDKGPDVPSKETFTLLHLQDTITDQPIAVFNTHLAFSKVDKRAAQAKKIHTILTQFHKTNPRVPLIVTGDMNTFPNWPDHTAFPFFDGDYTQSVLKKNLLVDTMDVAKLGHIGPLSTFTNVGDDPTPFKGTGTPGVYLDHIYVTKGITVLIHAINPVTQDGHFPSDHMPVIADIALPEKKISKQSEKENERSST